MLIAFIIVAFASAASAATASRRARPGPCSERVLCAHVPTRAAVIGTGVRAGSGPAGTVDRAITVSIAASAPFPHRVLCSVTCSDGATGTFSAHYDPEIMAGYFAPRTTDLEIGGSVFCLDVFGGNAVVGGMIEQSNVPAAIGLTYVVVIGDRGYPGRGRDLLGAAIFPREWTTTGFTACSSMQPGDTPLGRIGPSWPRLEDGNLLVVP